MVLALLGGSSGVVLCLHEAGILLLESAALANEEAKCADSTSYFCGTQDAHDCDWCLDVPVQGIELAQLRFEADDLQIDPPGFVFAIPFETWITPIALEFPAPTTEAPLALSPALLVVQTTVLRI